MEEERPSKLDYNIGCKFILDRLKEVEDPHEQLLLLCDFMTKFKNSGFSKIEPTVYDAIETYISPDLRDVFKPLRSPEDKIKENDKDKVKKSVDILIMTIILPELVAAKIALNIDIDRKVDTIFEGLRCWETQLSRSHGGKPLKVVLTMVGEPRTTPCALSCETIFHNYKIEEACVLIGIAAGVEKKVKLGDVVVAKSVIDYEGGSVDKKGIKKRPDPFPLKFNIRKDIVNYDPKRQGWHEEFQVAFKKMSEIEEVPEVPEKWNPNYHYGVILSGEKVIKDGSLQVKREEYTEEMRALEMEGSGFAAAWDKHNIPWAIFRGISDYGDQRKQGSKVWQSTAALAAATASVHFLRSEYTRQKAPEF